MRFPVLVEAASTAIIITVVGISVPFLIWLLLMFSRRLVSDTGMEVRVRRINLFEPTSYRLEVKFFNLSEKERSLSSLCLFYRDKSGIHRFAELSSPAFGAKADHAYMELEGKIVLEGNGSLLCIYPFVCSILPPEGSELYLSYKDEKGKRKYASFEDGNYYEQILNFRRRGWKVDE